MSQQKPESKIKKQSNEAGDGFVQGGGLRGAAASLSGTQRPVLPHPKVMCLLGQGRAGLDPSASLLTAKSPPHTRQGRGAVTLDSVDTLIQEPPQSSLHRRPKDTHMECAHRDLGGPKQQLRFPGSTSQQL